jgi:hypothetical protein
MRAKGYTSDRLCGVIADRILSQKDRTPEQKQASLKKRMNANAKEIEEYEKEAMEYKEKKEKERKDRKEKEKNQQTAQT